MIQGIYNIAREVLLQGLGNMDNKSEGAELWISWENTGMELDTFNYNNVFLLLL